MNYWPWWALFALVVLYEVVAVLCRRPTLSQIIWRYQSRARYPWLLPLITAVVMALVWAHLFAGLWQ
jgi:hypothetical protein